MRPPGKSVRTINTSFDVKMTATLPPLMFSKVWQEIRNQK